MDIVGARLAVEGVRWRDEIRMVGLLGTSLSGAEIGKLELWSERARDSARRARRFCLRVGVGVRVWVWIWVWEEGDGERRGVGVEDDGGVGNCEFVCD